MCHLCEERSYDGFRHAAPQQAPDGKAKPAAKGETPGRAPDAPPAGGAAK
jgi:hypothetical protein